MEFSKKSHNLIFHEFLTKLPESSGETVQARRFVPTQLKKGEKNLIHRESLL